jgi:hypothetical protein
MISHREVRRLLGDLDGNKVIAVLDLGPTLVEPEEAASYLPLLPENRRNISRKAERILDIVAPETQPAATRR